MTAPDWGGARFPGRPEPHFYLDVKIKKIKMSTIITSGVVIETAFLTVNGCSRWRFFVLAPISFQSIARA